MVIGSDASLDAGKLLHETQAQEGARLLDICDDVMKEYFVLAFE